MLGRVGSAAGAACQMFGGAVMKIEIDMDRRVIRVGEFAYSVDILDGGLVTAPGYALTIEASEPGPDGLRKHIVRSIKLEDR